MNLNILKNTELFFGMSEREITLTIDFLKAKTRKYKKGETVHHIGDNISSAGIILYGGVYIEQDDIWGNKNIISYVGESEMFGEAYACIHSEELMVNVTASDKSEILFLNFNKFLNSDASKIPEYSRLIKNLLSVIASKNLNLTRKINHTASKSIRGRVLAYLSYQATKQKKYSFEIPFSRQQLADYLCVDRSALSNELSKMQRLGMISYKKNRFTLNVDYCI